MGVTSQLVPAPGVIRSHPLFRALCDGANTPVVGWPSVNVTRRQFHSLTSNILHAQATPTTSTLGTASHSIVCALRSQITRFGGPKKSTRRIGFKILTRVRSGPFTPKGGNLNTDFSISRRFSRYGPRTPPKRSATRSQDAKAHNSGTPCPNSKCKE